MQRIAIHSVPRSGSSWLGEIFNSHPDVIYKYQPLFSFSFKSELTQSSSKEDILAFYNKIANSSDDFLNQTEARKNGKMPIFQKSKEPKYTVYKEVRYHYILENLLKKDSDLKVIGLIRNPFAVIHSWLKAPREFRKDLNWNEIEEWRFAPKKNLDKPEEFNGYEKWKEVTLLFFKLHDRFPNQIKVIFYEDLINDTFTVVEDIFSFCNIRYSESTKKFIQQSQEYENNDAYSVFKTKISDNGWKDDLNKTIIKTISTDLKNNNLQKYFNK